MRSLVGLLLPLLLPTLVLAQEESWFPLAEGNTWKYASKVKVKVEVGPFGDVKKRLDTPLRVTAVCGAPSMIGGELFYPVQWTDNTGALDSRVWIRCEGMQIHIARSLGGRLLLLPGDLNQGHGVNLKFGYGDKKAALKSHSVGAPTAIRVAAGNYQAIPVFAKLQVTPIKATTTVWYALGVGPVVIHERIKLKGTDTQHKLQLTSFTPGRRQPAAPPEIPTRPAPRAQPTPTQPVPTQPVPHAQPYPSAEPIPPAQPEPRGQVGNGFRLVQELVAHGNPEKWRELEALSAQAAALSAKLGLMSVRRQLPDAQQVVSGLASGSVLDDMLLVSDGPVQALAIDGSFVFMNGDLTVSGNVLGSVIICSGNVIVTGTIKNSLILSRGEVRTQGYTKSSLFQARSVSATGFSSTCIYVDTQRRVAQSKRDVVKAAPGPLNLFDGK